MKRKGLSIALLASAISSSALAVAPGEEVDVTAGAVTAISCAVRARDSGNLDLLGACSPAEAAKGLVVYDVAERQVYRISPKKVFRYELEKAFGGGSIDFTGKVVSVEAGTGVVTVDVDEYSITAKPKAGAFKGCL